MTSVKQIDLGYRPRPWQAECRAAFKRFNVLVVHRRGGKTVMAMTTLIDAALRTPKERARYAYVAPLRTQAKGIAWDYLKGYALRVPGTKVSEQELWVEFPNGSRIRLYGADNPDSLRGLYLDGVVIDEVAQMKPQTWGEVLRPALADRLGWALFIGTPHGTDFFSGLYYSALAGSYGEDWFARLYTIHDTEVLDAEEVAAARESMSEAQFRQEFLCDFSAASDNQLVSLEEVRTAIKRSPDMDRVERSPKILGVDVARYGDDRSVIAQRQGPLLLPLHYYRKIDNMSLAGNVAHIWREWDADACFVDNGRGEGVIDALRDLGFNPIGVDFGGTQGVPNGYRRKRDQMYGDQAEWIRTQACLPDDPEYAAAITSLTYTWGTVQHAMEVESKDAIRKRGLPSPDPADSVGLTFAAPVVPRSFADSPLAHVPRHQQFADMDQDDYYRAT